MHHAPRTTINTHPSPLPLSPPVVPKNQAAPKQTIAISTPQPKLTYCPRSHREFTHRWRRNMVVRETAARGERRSWRVVLA